MIQKQFCFQNLKTKQFCDFKMKSKNIPLWSLADLRMGGAAQLYYKLVWVG